MAVHSITQAILSTIAQPPRPHAEFIPSEEQEAYISYALSGKSCVLTGDPGSGKTTTQSEFIKRLLLAQPHRKIIACAFTHMTCKILRERIPQGVEVSTIHALLQYAPAYVDRPDGSTSRQFLPRRNKLNPLPSDIDTIIIEEASNVALDLYANLAAALSHKVQLIFVGDICQLPPVGMPGVLGFAFDQLPIFNLTKIYRQGDDSPIKALVYDIVQGQSAPYKNKRGSAISKPPGLSATYWIQREPAEIAMEKAWERYLKPRIASGEYDPWVDMILIPFNEGFGQIEINKKIANHLARERGATTYEILAGFEKVYLSPGDRVRYRHWDGVVEKITTNFGYNGKPVQHPSPHLSYWGHLSGPEAQPEEEFDEFDDDAFLAAAAGHYVESSDDSRVHAASHRVFIRTVEDEIIELSTADELNNLYLGHCMTIYKSQGCEWPRVFVLMHHSNAVQASRESMYVACSRARESLNLLIPSDYLAKCIDNPRIQGNTPEEKRKSFREKIKSLPAGIDLPSLFTAATR